MALVICFCTSLATALVAACVAACCSWFPIDPIASWIPPMALACCAPGCGRGRWLRAEDTGIREIEGGEGEEEEKEEEEGVVAGETVAERKRVREGDRRKGVEEQGLIIVATKGV